MESNPSPPFRPHSAIGQGWTRKSLWLACVVGGLVLGVDNTMAIGQNASIARLGLGLSAILVYSWLPGGKPATVGLRTQIEPSRTYWLRTALWLGAIVGAGTALLIGILAIAGRPLVAPKLFQTSSQFLPYLRAACLWAPIEEELLYRAVLCAPLAVLLPRKAVVLIGGFAFAGLHYRYGALSPNHLFAGFVLTWAYLKSGNLAVPIVLHALGNLLVFAFEVVRYRMGT